MLAKVKNGRAHAVDLATAGELGAFSLAYRDWTLENGGVFDDRELKRWVDELAQSEARSRNNMINRLLEQSLRSAPVDEPREAS